MHHAYRLFLGRDPDPSGLAHYLAQVRRGLPLDELIRQFVSSDEYHARAEAQRRADDQPVDLGGYRLLASTRDPDFGEHIHAFREYEEPVRRALRAHLHAGGTVLDVGANIGVMTFLAASIVGPSGRVIAVEPNPGNVQLLYRSVVLNGFTNVEVLPLAASDRREIFALTGRSNTHLVGAPAAGGGGDYVQSIVLDDWLAHLDRLDLVKIDIEGHEPAALRGLRTLIDRHRPVLVVEFNPRCLEIQGEPPRQYLEWLLERYPSVRAISHFDDDLRFERPDDLLAFWRGRADELAARGDLPAGMLHLDLVAAP